MTNAEFNNCTDEELVRLSGIRLNQFERVELIDLVAVLGARLGLFLCEEEAGNDDLGYGQCCSSFRPR